MSSPVIARVSFKEKMLQAREEAIVKAVSRLLAEKSFEAMTVDEVAAEVGIAKASLYKHFPSKEDLAASAMVRVMRRVQDFLLSLPMDDAPLDKLRAAVRWTMALQLAGEMPSLPGQNCSLRTTLMAYQAYLDGLRDLSERLGGWIEAAQRMDAQPQTAGYGGALHPVCAGLRPGAGVPQGRRPVQQCRDRRTGDEHLF